MTATTIVQTQIRKRSLMGKLVKWTFILFNLLMAFWLFSYWAQLGEMAGTLRNDAERAGAAIGGTLGTGMLIFFWAAGSIVLGTLTMLTRGKLIITERRHQ